MTAEGFDFRQPPPPRPRRRNVLLVRLYDSPIFRDPFAWWTAFVVVSVAISLATSQQPTAMPRWLEALVGTVVMTAIFAVLPAVLRLQLRRWLWRRRRRAREGLEGEVGREPSTAVQDPAGMPKTDTPRMSDPAQRSQLPPNAVRMQPADVQGANRGTGARHAITQYREAVNAAHPLSDDALANSQALRAARDLQFPVARAVRALQTAPTSKEQYEALLDVADALTITVGASAAAWLRSTGDGLDELAELRGAYERGVTQGSWHLVTRKAAQLARDAERGALPGLGPAASSSRKGSLLSHLSDLTKERNLWAHGSAPRTAADASQRLSRLFLSIESALGQAAFLVEAPWVLTLKSSYKPRENLFEVSVFNVMGDHPEFERSKLTAATPLADGRLYMLSADVDPIDLTPFVVRRDCNVCGHPEIFYADKLPRSSSAVLKSFGNGHPMTDESLDEEIIGLGQQRPPGPGE